MLYREGKNYRVVDTSGVARTTRNLKQALRMESLVNVVSNLNDKRSKDTMKEMRELKRMNKSLYESKRIGERGTNDATGKSDY